jgi:peptidoglycan-associated lipoprotein
MKAFARVLAVLIPVAVLWGCSTTGQEEPSAAGAGAGAEVTTGPETGGAEMGGGVEVGGVQGGGAVSGTELETGMLSKRVVYFDFDKSVIKPDARQIIEAHANYLSANPNVHVTLEGHCDERGTREYNLGLGERRAKAVEQVMSLLGVSASQMEVVSYGEERPAAMGHDESAWALNRRVEIVY